MKVSIFLEHLVELAAQKRCSLAAALKEARAEVEWHPCPGRHDAAFCNDRLPDVIRWLNIHGIQKS